MKDYRCYICGPIRGDGRTAVRENVQRAIDAANDLLNAGVNVFVPHLDYFLQEWNPKMAEWTTEDWMAFDEPWLRQCDAVLRLPGYSECGQKETALAYRLEMPVFNTIPEVIAASKKMRRRTA